MKGLIFNASPLILLGKIDLLDAIPAITPQFLIPQEVVLEIGAGPATDPTIQWLCSESRTRHIVESPFPPANLLQWDLGVGETAVLALALNRLLKNWARSRVEQDEGHGKERATRIPSAG